MCVHMKFTSWVKLQTTHCSFHSVFQLDDYGSGCEVVVCAFFSSSSSSYFVVFFSSSHSCVSTYIVVCLYIPTHICVFVLLSHIVQKNFSLHLLIKIWRFVRKQRTLLYNVRAHKKLCNKYINFVPFCLILVVVVVVDCRRCCFANFFHHHHHTRTAKLK